MKTIDRDIRLRELLERYYEGQTEPEEEFALYLKLLDTPPSSSLYPDALVLRAQFEGLTGASRAEASNPKPMASPSRMRRYASWAVGMAAALLLILQMPLSEWGDAPLALEEGLSPRTEASAYRLAWSPFDLGGGLMMLSSCSPLPPTGPSVLRGEAMYQSVVMSSGLYSRDAQPLVISIYASRQPL